LTTDKKIERLQAFKAKLDFHRNIRDSKLERQSREWLNQNVHWVRREVGDAGCHKIITVSPPPAVGGIIAEIDPFDSMFETHYGRSLVPIICDMIDHAIGVLRDPPPAKNAPEIGTIMDRVQRGYAFVAMPIDKDDHQLVDVLDAIKNATA